MNRKLSALAVISVLMLPMTVLADQPFEIGYQWSFSKRQYVTTSTELIPLKFNFSFDAIGGYEVKSGALPSLGVGIGYSRKSNGFDFKAGLFLLFPQNQQPDAGFGFTFVARF